MQTRAFAIVQILGLGTWFVGGCDPARDESVDSSETGNAAGSSGREESGGAEPSEADTEQQPGSTVDPAEVARRVAGYESFVRVTTEAIPSAHGLADTIHIWVPEADVPSFEAASAGEPPDFTEGALIIKEQFDAAGGLNSLTVMYKGPEGHAPDAGDWWWGFFGPDLSLQNGGAIEACIGCHQSAESTGWVYGL